MSSFSEFSNKEVTRRDFIFKASSLAGFCLLNCKIAAQQPVNPQIVKALDDKNVIHGKIALTGEINAYLSRPKKKGRYPIVIVVSGSSYDDEYIRNLTAMLAQKNFVGISPNIFYLQKETATPEEKRKIFAEQITDEKIFQVLESAIDYLKKQNFVHKKRIGIMGFCFGGRCALMFAAHSKKIDAVVPFYGNLRTPAFANRTEDPLDISDKIKAPIQGHYAQHDKEIPIEQLKILRIV